jgi:hypothetical protein
MIRPMFPLVRWHKSLAAFLGLIADFIVMQLQSLLVKCKTTIIKLASSSLRQTALVKGTRPDHAMKHSDLIKATCRFFLDQRAKLRRTANIIGELKSIMLLLFPEGAIKN